MKEEIQQKKVSKDILYFGHINVVLFKSFAKD